MDNVVEYFVLDARYAALGVECFYPFNPYKYPHSLVVGATNSGKTVCSKLLLGKIGIHIPEASIVAIDYKGLDFSFLEGCPGCFVYDSCTDGLTRFYAHMQARQQGAEAIDKPLFLFVDEWAALINSITEKKEQERVKAMLASILMLGRGLRCFVIVAVQRPDAALFSGGARDNFSRVIALGNISKESKEMLFKDYKEEMTASKRQGEGWMLLDGQPLSSIIVPHIPKLSMPKLHAAIREAVMRGG
jgi:DNA segregation ATPase FtsK/SpoIIIE-like protein